MRKQLQSLLTRLRESFMPIDAQRLAKHQLEEAKREQLLHESAAKYHEAMTKYYRDTAQRLASYQG